MTQSTFEGNCLASQWGRFFLRPGKTWSTLNMNISLTKVGELHFWLGFRAFFFIVEVGYYASFLGFLGCFCLMSNWGPLGFRLAQIPDGPGGWPSYATAPNGGDVMSHTFLKTMTFNISPIPLMMLPFPLLQLWWDESFDSKHGWLFMPSSTGFMSAVVEYWCFIKLKIFNFEHCNSRFEREDHDFPIASMGLVCFSNLLDYQFSINIKHPCI